MIVPVEIKGSGRVNTILTNIISLNDKNKKFEGLFTNEC